MVLGHSQVIEARLRVHDGVEIVVHVELYSPLTVGAFLQQIILYSPLDNVQRMARLEVEAASDFVQDRLRDVFEGIRTREELAQIRIATRAIGIPPMQC
jgi:hypothetical protein